MTDVEEQTEFKFSELSEKAKEAARQEYISGDYPYDDWWDGVYEDAVRMAAILGIEISMSQHTSHKGRNYSTTDISFSGVWSQGDGASFEGTYRLAPDAVKNIEQETTDAELLRIATALSLLQTTRRLLGLEPFSAAITTSGRYSHSGMMDVTLSYDEDEDGETSYDDALGTQVTQLMRDFADWIYQQLEAEHEHLTSDEVVDEQLAEIMFDEYGNCV